MAKTAAATAAYALAHSVLASDSVKRATARLAGGRSYDGLYRVLYNAQALAALFALRTYVKRLPDRELYRAGGSAAPAMRAGQAAGLAYMAWAQWHVGPLRFTGLDSLGAWAGGADDVPHAAIGQGPSPGPGGHMHAAGPFLYSRHPLNVAAMAVLWLQPRMTANLLAFNLVATAYFVYGSHREEVRLRAAYGRAYVRYQRSGVHFFLPRPASAAKPSIASGPSRRRTADLSEAGKPGDTPGA